MGTLRTRFAVLAAVGAVSTAGIGIVAAPADAQVVARCGNGSLAVTRTYSQGGDGHGWMSLVYRNTGSRSCTVTGYPGLDAITASGHVLAHAKRTLGGYGGGGTVHTVTVQPGGYASASVEWLNFNATTGGDCAFSAAVNTIVADTTQVHRLPVSVSACELQVHPTVAGTPGYPNFGPAQRYWIQGSTAISAQLDHYLLGAEQQLKTATVYPTQVKQLAQLAALPETSLTPAQITLAHADVKALDGFFGTPGLYA